MTLRTWLAISALPVLLTLGACTPTSAPGGPSSSQIPPPAPQIDYAHISGRYPQPATTTTAGQSLAPVEGCVNVEGADEQTHLTVVDCAAPHAYIVVQRVTRPSECVADADRFLHMKTGDQEWTACLDLAWDAARCISLGLLVTSVDCDNTTAINRYKPVNLLLNAVDVAGCPNGGYRHPVRRFTICTQLVG